MDDPIRPDTTSEPTSLDRVEALDEDVFEEVAIWRSSFLDRLLPGLSIAASYSRLWAGVVLLVALFGGSKGRRSAIAAMAASRQPTWSRPQTRPREASSVAAFRHP